MADWDEAKLRSVVSSKHGNPQTTTDKVCKYFIDAVENGKYGWFWTCPNNGNDCKYKVRYNTLVGVQVDEMLIALALATSWICT